MKTELSTTQAADILLSDEYANWTRPGAMAIVEYFEELEDDMGESFEIDRVAIRCEYSEYSSAAEWCADFYDHAPTDLPPTHVLAYLVDESADTVEEAIIEHIRYSSDCITFDGGIIVRDF